MKIEFNSKKVKGLLLFLLSCGILQGLFYLVWSEAGAPSGGAMAGMLSPTMIIACIGGIWGLCDMDSTDSN